MSQFELIGRYGFVVDELKSNGGSIVAIKFIRELIGIDLKKAKFIIDKWGDIHSIYRALEGRLLELTFQTKSSKYIH